MYIYHKQKCNPHEKIDDIHNEYYKKGKEKGT